MVKFRAMHAKSSYRLPSAQRLRPLQDCKHIMPSDYTFDRQIYGNRLCVFHFAPPCTSATRVPLISDLNALYLIRSGKFVEGYSLSLIGFQR